jgi:hypothetical protein
VSTTYDQITDHGCGKMSADEGYRQAFIANGEGQMLEVRP